MQTDLPDGGAKAEVLRDCIFSEIRLEQNGFIMVVKACLVSL